MRHFIFFLTLLISTSILAQENSNLWVLDQVVETHGQSVLGLTPFPEYFRLIKNEENNQSTLVVKLRNQNHEKKYLFVNNASVINRSNQTYKASIIEFAEEAIVEAQNDEISLNFSWTRKDKPNFFTSSIYKITFEDDDTVNFIRINGAKSDATYLEFRATYKKMK